MKHHRTFFPRELEAQPQLEWHRRDFGEVFHGTTFFVGLPQSRFIYQSFIVILIIYARFL